MTLLLTRPSAEERVPRHDARMTPPKSERLGSMDEAWAWLWSGEAAPAADAPIGRRLGD